MAETQARSATVAALLLRGHDPAPILDAAPNLNCQSRVPLIFDHSVGSGELFALQLEEFRRFAIIALANDIARAAGEPLSRILSMLCSMPAEYETMLDDCYGWVILGDMIADQLGIFNVETPLISFPTN